VLPALATAAAGQACAQSQFPLQDPGASPVLWKDPHRGACLLGEKKKIIGAGCSTAWTMSRAEWASIAKSRVRTVGSWQVSEWGGARKKFGGAKAISSQQYFDRDNKELEGGGPSCRLAEVPGEPGEPNAALHTCCWWWDVRVPGDLRKPAPVLHGLLLPGCRQGGTGLSAKRCCQGIEGVPGPALGAC